MATMSIQVGDTKREMLKNYSLETYKSLSPLNWLLNLFSINSNVEDAVYSKTSYIIQCLLVIVTLASLDIVSMCYKIAYIFKFTQITASIKITDTVQMIYDLCQYMVDLWIVYKYGRHISVEYFRQYESIDEILGMRDYSKIKRKLLKLLGFFTFIWLVSSASDFAAWTLSYGWITPMAYAMSYIFLYIKILTTLDLSSHVMHIKYRLVIIGDIVQHYYSTAESLPGIMGNYLIIKNRIYESACSRKNAARVYPMKLRLADECLEIKWLARVYLQLTEQVEFINCIFGFRILLNSLSLLIDIIRFTNIAVRIVLGTQVIPNETIYFPVASSLMKQLTCVLVLISLVKYCEKAYRQRDRIISTIDHITINKNPSDKLREALVELRDLVQARPINFNLARFFRLDNSLLVSIASVVVTYTIILLQTAS